MMLQTPRDFDLKWKGEENAKSTQLVASKFVYFNKQLKDLMNAGGGRKFRTNGAQYHAHHTKRIRKSQGMFSEVI